MTDGRLRDVEAVLFDMDGTIVDSDAAVDRAWVAWALEHGLPGEATMAPPGQPALTTVRQLLPDLDDAAAQKSARRQMELQYDDLDGVVALPGAHELFALLAGRNLPWAVVTSADRLLAVNRLNAAGIVVETLVPIEDSGRGKPHADPFLAGAAALGVAPERCLVVEDSVTGVRAGHAAGMLVAALKGVGGDIPITDLHELARLLTPSS